MSDSYAPALPGIGIRIESEATPPLLEWFAVQTRPRFEKKVVAQLVFKSIGVYLPVRTESHTWSDRRKSVTIPLFPGYAFVHVSPSRQAWQPVLQTAGLLGFVNFGGIVMAVPAKQITDLQLLLQQKVSYSLHPFAQAGRRVRIRGGCLDGLEGVVAQENGRLVVSIVSIQRSLAIEVQGYDLELV